VVFVIVVWYSCGLAALAMAGQLLTGSSLDASQLLQTAVECHFSFRGEMFSGLFKGYILSREFVFFKFSSAASVLTLMFL